MECGGYGGSFGRSFGRGCKVLDIWDFFFLVFYCPLFVLRILGGSASPSRYGGTLMVGR